jgi:hypothetical protein
MESNGCTRVNLIGICYIEALTMLLVGDMEVQIYQREVATFSS